MSLNIKNTDGTLTKIAGKTLMTPVNNITTSESLQDAPVGHILTYMGNTAPAHYLICDGATYNIADYLDLANHFKKEFGSINYFGGDGTTTFAVPDLRGEFLRGTGSNGHTGQGNGAATGVHQDATEIPNVYGHSELLWIQANMYSLSEVSENLSKNYDSFKGRSGYIQATGKTTVKESESTPSMITIRPTNTSVLYCIKYEPTYFMEVQEVDYSLDEVYTGKRWIDGKPIYRKVLKGLKLPAVTTEFAMGTTNVNISTTYNITNVLQYVSCQAMYNNGVTLPAIWGAGSTQNFQFVSMQHGNQLVIINNRINNSNKDIIVVLEYTKTTD